MATRTITGKVYNLLDQPVQGAKLKFILNLSAFTADKEYQSSFTETITDALGNWSVTLWVNSESLSSTSYTCVDVDESRFIFTIDPGVTPLTYSQIKALGTPVITAPQSLLGLISTQIATKADQTALTSGLALKTDQTALISALATKVNTTDLTPALLLKADQTALTSGLALKENTNFPNGRASVNLMQSTNQSMPGGYVYNKYIFGTVIKDNLNEWNSVNSFYTATQAGLYMVMLGLDSDNSTSRKFSIMMNYQTSSEILTLFDIQNGNRSIATSMFQWAANTQVYFINRCPDTFNTVWGNTFLKIERIL